MSYPPSAALTFDGAVARNLLGHQRSLLVSAVDLHDLLPTLAALGSGQSGDGFLPADLAPRPLLLLRLHAARRRLRPVERGIPIGPLERCRDGGIVEVGAVVTGSRLDRRDLEELIGRFFQHALNLGLVQLEFSVCDRRSLALGSCSEVTVAVDGVKVFGDRVLVVVAVGAKFLFGAEGMVDVL